MHWNQEETGSLPAPCLPSGLITRLGGGTCVLTALLPTPSTRARVRRLQRLQRQLSTFAG